LHVLVWVNALLNRMLVHLSLFPANLTSTKMVFTDKKQFPLQVIDRCGEGRLVGEGGEATITSSIHGLVHKSFKQRTDKIYQLNFQSR